MTAKALALALAVSSCAAPLPIPVEQARARLDGFSPAQVAACMGPSPLRRERGQTVLWSYPSPTATSSAPMTLTDPASATYQYAPLDGDPLGQGLGIGVLGVSEGPTATSGCIVNVVFDGGRVATVTYAGPNGHLLRQDAECTALVQSCKK